MIPPLLLAVARGQHSPSLPHDRAQQSPTASFNAGAPGEAGVHPLGPEGTACREVLLEKVAHLVGPGLQQNRLSWPVGVGTGGTQDSGELEAMVSPPLWGKVK